MLNWTAFLINSCWAFGLALLLATISYHIWQAFEARRGLREQLSRPSFQAAAWFSLMLVGIGLVGTSQTTWETVLWLLFTIITLVNGGLAWRVNGRFHRRAQRNGN